MASVGDTATTIINLPEFPVTQIVDVHIKFAAHSVADDRLLDGAPGKLARLHGAMHMLEKSWDRGWAPDILIEAAQTGRRISLHPESAVEELRKLDRVWPEILKAIDSSDGASLETAFERSRTARSEWQQGGAIKAADESAQ